MTMEYNEIAGKAYAVGTLALMWVIGAIMLMATLHMG